MHQTSRTPDLTLSRLGVDHWENRADVRKWTSELFVPIHVSDYWPRPTKIGVLVTGPKNTAEHNAANAEFVTRNIEEKITSSTVPQMAAVLPSGDRAIQYLPIVKILIIDSKPQDKFSLRPTNLSCNCKRPCWNRIWHVPPTITCNVSVDWTTARMSSIVLESQLAATGFSSH